MNSEKILRAQLGNDIVDDPKISIDKKNILYQNGFDSIYPVLYKIQGGKIEIEESLSPGESDILLKFQ